MIAVGVIQHQSCELLAFLAVGRNPTRLTTIITPTECQIERRAIVNKKLK